MSRTDKDVPYQVRAHRAPVYLREAYHHRDCVHYISYTGSPGNGTAPCDLDRTKVAGRCSWWVYDRDRFPWTGAPGKDNRRMYFHAPSRHDARSALEAARRDYNAGGYDDPDWEPDVEPDNRRAAGRGSLWGGGYWD